MGERVEEVMGKLGLKWRPLETTCKYNKFLGVQVREVWRRVLRQLTSQRSPSIRVGHWLAELNMVVCTWVLVAQAQEQPAVAAL